MSAEVKPKVFHRDARPIPVDGEEAWKRLQSGNSLFCRNQEDGRYQRAERSVEIRNAFKDQQHPFATILCCSDSRAPPEYIFGEGFGALFVVRVAGNVVDDAVLGTLEYGLEHLHTPLLVVMGHTSCGAVKAAISEKNRYPSTPLGDILKLVEPAVDAALSESYNDSDVLDSAIKKNILNSKKTLLNKSQVIRKLVDSSKVKVVTAIYSLENGQVQEIQDSMYRK